MDIFFGDVFWVLGAVFWGDAFWVGMTIRGGVRPGFQVLFALHLTSLFGSSPRRRDKLYALK